MFVHLCDGLVYTGTRAYPCLSHVVRVNKVPLVSRREQRKTLVVVDDITESFLVTRVHEPNVTVVRIDTIK